MIDFPNSPTDGQIFSATNGVVYKYSAAYTSWLAQAPPPVIGGTGQVTALSGSFLMDNNIADRIAFATVVSGNAGLWWNTGTSRYTPPAGSYFLSCVCTVLAPSGGNGTATLYLRKNGTQVGYGITGSGSASFNIPLTLGEYVDANGTDYFEWWVLGAAANMQMQGAMFSAFPLTGIQGPTGGPPGSVVGDFCAVNNSGFALPVAATTVAPPVVTGNSGSYYNTSTGRYTPPAGRYKFTGTLSGTWTGGANGLNLIFRKNGVTLQQSNGTTANASYYAACVVDGIYDANGSDWFDWQIASGSGGTCSFLSISSTPTQGMVGPQGPPGAPWASGPVGSDFFTQFQTTGIGTTPATVLFPAPMTGNSGGYYNPANGRYTPPAGRYLIFATIGAGLNSAATLINAWVRKNGTSVVGASQVPAAANWYGDPSVCVILDANGTDWFDIQAYASSGSNLSTWCWFGATPTMGLAGPQGAAGNPGAAGTPGTPGSILRNFFTGFGSSSTGAKVITWAVGQATNSTNAVWIQTASSLAKSILGTWAAGNNQGGMGTGVTAAASTWYYPFAIINGGVADIYIDNNLNATNAPAGTTAFRRLRPFKTDPGTNIPFHATKGDLVQYKAAIQEINNVSLGTAGVDYTGTISGVPPGIQTVWQGHVTMTTTGSANGLVGLSVRTPATTRGSSSMDYSSAGGGQCGGQVSVLTDTSQAILFTAPSIGVTATALFAYTTGFIDDCGRYD